MRDVYEVLREKEQAVERVVREIQVLRLAARMLRDESDAVSPAIKAPSAGAVTEPWSVQAGRPVGPSVAAVKEHVPLGAEVAETIKANAKKISTRLKRLAATPLLNNGQAAS